jgi:hypothetical protein
VDLGAGEARPFPIPDDSMGPSSWTPDVWSLDGHADPRYVAALTAIVVTLFAARRTRLG